MFGFRIHSNSAPGCTGQRVGHNQHVVERRNQKLPVVRVRPERQALPGPERAQLGQREVFGKPSADGVAVDHFCTASAYGLEDVLGAVPAGTTMRDDERGGRGHDHRGRCPRGPRRGR